MANLADKVHIDEFYLEWYFYDEASNLRDSDMGVLEGCKPPAQLSKLHIIGERGRPELAAIQSWHVRKPTASLEKPMPGFGIIFINRNVFSPFASSSSSKTQETG